MDATLLKIGGALFAILSTMAQMWVWYLIKKNDEEHKSQWDQIDRRAMKEDVDRMEDRFEDRFRDIRDDIKNSKDEVVLHITHLVDLLRK